MPAFRRSSIAAMIGAVLRVLITLDEDDALGLVLEHGLDPLGHDSLFVDLRDR